MRSRRRLGSTLRWAAVVFPIGCGTASARFETTDPNAELKPSRPPAIVLDPKLRLPAVETTGPSEGGLLVLRAPRELDAIRSVVRRFFRAMIRESPSEIDGLLSDPAWLDATSGRAPAKNALRGRLAQLDFTALQGVLPYREREIEVYRASELGTLSEARSMPNDLGTDEVFVRVRVIASHAGKSRLFPDEMTFTLRAEQDGLRIVRIAENTQVP